MADSPEKRKRKREVKEVDEGINEARITYHTPFKTFERLFNEASLDDTKRVVRAKLGLEPNVGMELSQLRGGSRIALEDEDDFRAFCVALKANPQVDVQVTISDAVHSNAMRAQDAEIAAPATKKRKTKQSIAPTPSNPTAATAYATPANSTTHAAFSTSSFASLPPSSASASPGTVTSPLLPFPSLPTLFTTPASIPVAAVRTLPSAKGVLGPTPTPKGSGKDKKKDRASEKVDRSAAKETDEEDREKEEKREKKEKPKRVRKKSEAASAPAAPMSPAAREKAAAILERHRQAIAERAKAPRKRTKKADAAAGVKEPTKDRAPESKAAERSPTSGDEDVEQGEESDPPKKEKRKKKKKKQVAEEEAEREEQDIEDDIPESPREESPPETARRESSSKEKKGRKKKDKESSSPIRASVPPGTLAGGDDGDGDVDVNMEHGAEEMKEITTLDEKPKEKSKLPTVAPNAKLVPVVRRPADASTILDARKGDKPIIVSPTILAPAPAPIKPPPTSTVKKAASITSAKLPPPPAPKGTAATPKAGTSAPNLPRAVCLICLKPFHLRFQCPLLQTRGPALNRRLAELDRTGHTKLVGELRGWLETEKKRDQLRALGKPGNSGTMGKNGQGGRAVVVLSGDSDEDDGGAEGSLKKRLMSFESEERNEPEEDEEKEVESDGLGDPDATEDEEDDDDDGRANSVPASLGRPTMSKPSLVSVEKPGEGSEMTSSDSAEDEEMEPIVLNEDDDEDDDDKMGDTSRTSTPQAPSRKTGDQQKTSCSSSSSSTRSDSPLPPTKGKAGTPQNKSTKPPSTARSPRSFRGINDEPDDGATDAVHQLMQHDTAQVLVPNSDDSGDAEMEADNNAQEEEKYHEKPHTPNASESRASMDRLFQRRGSPVAKGRTPGTPSRAQVMKDRHGNTAAAPVQRTYRDDGFNGDEYSPPSGHPFPNHKLQPASQSSTLPSRKSMLPRLSNFSVASVRDAASNLFKGAPAASSPTAQAPPTPISIPPSGRVLNGTTDKDFQDESTSSSSTESDSNSGLDAPRVPKGRRAGATLAMPPKKSVLANM